MVNKSTFSLSILNTCVRKQAVMATVPTTSRKSTIKLLNPQGQHRHVEMAQLMCASFQLFISSLLLEKNTTVWMLSDFTVFFCIYPVLCWSTAVDVYPNNFVSSSVEISSAIDHYSNSFFIFIFFFFNMFSKPFYISGKGTL